MKVVKLRAWNIRDKKFLYDFVLDLANGDILPDIPVDRSIDYCLKHGEYILMLYIGRKDKKGKEIYEGDYLSCKYMNQHGKETEIIGIVYWAEGECGMSIDCGTYADFKFKNWSSVEVIGNKFENPEITLG